MRKRRRVIGSNAEAKTDAGPNSNADVELDSELQGDSEEGGTRVPRPSRPWVVRAKRRRHPPIFAAKVCLQRRTVAELEKLYNNIDHATDSLYDLIENQREFEVRSLSYLWRQTSAANIGRCRPIQIFKSKHGTPLSGGQQQVCRTCLHFQSRVVQSSFAQVVLLKQPKMDKT